MKTLRPFMPLVLLALAAGCAHKDGNTVTTYAPMTLPPAAQQASARGGTVNPDLVAANNGMGLALFNQVAQGAPEGDNLFLSPLSVALCLEMTYNGSGGQTTTAMGQALEVGSMTPLAVAQANAVLLANLASADPQVDLVAAQSVWARQGIQPAFLSLEQNYFGAQLASMPATAAPVNAWISQETQGLIPKLLDPNLDLSGIQVLLANAMYFKGTWTTAFSTANTAAAPFTRADGSGVTCQMMGGQQVKVASASTVTYLAARLPYGNGRYGLVVVMPTGGASLASVASGLTAQTWQALMASLTSRTCEVHLPKFKSTWAGDLSAALKALGMGIAFDPAQADFSAMAPGLYIGFVQHGATVEVDESGTTAAAGTAIGMPSAVDPGAVLVFDHPFLYAIQDAQTGEILFLGRMLDPTGN